MPKAALAFLVLTILAVTQLAWGDEPPRKTEDKPADKTGPKTTDVLLDRPQEVTLLLFNDKKRPVYLVQLTFTELSYKGSATGTEVVKYAAKDGHVLEIHVAGGGTFLFNKGTGKFEVGVPIPGTVTSKPPEKTPDKPPDKTGDKPPDKKVEVLQLTPLEQAILDLANKERAKEGVPPLKPAAKLVQLARAHSVNMAKQNKLDHFLDGKSPVDRAREIGYPAPVLENCAWGMRTAPEVVQGWMNSPGHRANLLNKNATEVGIGYASADRSVPFYTMIFGVRHLR